MLVTEVYLEHVCSRVQSWTAALVLAQVPFVFLNLHSYSPSISLAFYKSSPLYERFLPGFHPTESTLASSRHNYTNWKAPRKKSTKHTSRTYALDLEQTLYAGYTCWISRVGDLPWAQDPVTPIDGFALLPHTHQSPITIKSMVRRRLTISTVLK